MNLITASVAALMLVLPNGASAQSGIIVRCGASAGHAYFFYDSVTNPGGAEWQDDGISNGKFILINIDEEWDIQFSDSIGGYGYRQDGAEVFLLGSQSGKMTIAAVHPNYTDIYTFDLLQEEAV